MKISEVEVDGRKMFVQDSSSERARVTESAPHSHYAIRRKDVHVEVSAFKTISEKIGNVGSVVELFGGSGWHSGVIQAQNKPVRHTALDFSEDCVASIARSLPSVEVQQADSYDWAQRNLHRGFSWIHADFNNLTFMKWGIQNAQTMKPATPDSLLVDSIFRYSAKWVTLTDSAAFGLCRFERNRAAYRRVFNEEVRPDDWRNYYGNVAAVVAARYGFECRDVVVWRRMAGMFLFERSDTPKRWSVREHKEAVTVKLVRTWEE